MNLSERIKQLAEQHFEDLVSTRRHLHSHPELSIEEYETKQLIGKKLQENGYDVKAITETGGEREIAGTDASRKLIARRADIDALASLEQNEVA